MTIYIIVLHYKNIADTKACLDSISKIKTKGYQITTILINNNPKEDLSTLKYLRNIFIQNKQNLGFAKAVNIGIRKALEDPEMSHVMLLNNDTIVPSDLIEKLLELSGDIVGPVIKFKSLSGAWVYDYGGMINWSTGRTTHIEKNHLADTTIPAGLIDYISGCCLMIPRRVIESVGFLDERFFFYFEDVDYCVRAARKGYNITVCPSVAVTHKLSASIGRWSWKAIVYNLASNLLFITKHLGIMVPFGYLYLGILSTKIIINKTLSRS
jgi:GT2 family glycosyltransferase